MDGSFLTARRERIHGMDWEFAAPVSQKTGAEAAAGCNKVQQQSEINRTAAACLMVRTAAAL